MSLEKHMRKDQRHPSQKSVKAEMVHWWLRCVAKIVSDSA